MQLPPPKNSSNAGIDSWLAKMRTWRNQCTTQLGYMNGTVGPNQPGMEWTATSYVTVQSHPYDNFLYPYAQNGIVRNHTVARFLEDLRLRYGGVDSVLIWPTCKYMPWHFTVAQYSTKTLL